jgi:hypothetical protein
MLMEHLAKGMASRIVADYLEMLMVTLSKVSIVILVAIIHRVQKGNESRSSAVLGGFVCVKRIKKKMNR